jgi:predicted RNA-binding Zn ribbon-like protein
MITVRTASLVQKFQLVGGHVALDFANTLDFRYDPERKVDLLRDYDHLLEFARQSGVITRREARTLLLKTSASDRSLTLNRAIEVREAIDSLFRAVMSGKSPRRSCLRVLNEFLAKTPAAESLSWKQNEFVRSYADLTATPDAPLQAIVDTAVNLLISPDRSKIRECGEPTCRWLFLDHSKNHSRRWCDMRVCGNRSKVQRFRARQRDRS